jgi:hypothetical protein
MPASDNADKIVSYWNRRSRLTEAEWVDFNRCVVPLLLRTRLPEEYSDPDRRMELINDFFQDKILFNAETSRAGALTSAHALHRYLKNYALDQLPKSPSEQAGPAGEEEMDVDLPAEPVPLPEAQLLKEAGINVEDAVRSANYFVGQVLDDGDRAYLRYASCADVKPEPVSRIAERLDIGTTFHFKAKKLGITRSKGETYRGYEKTKIGAWLLSTGAELHPDWRTELAALLNLLCQQVRLHVGVA